MSKKLNACKISKLKYKKGFKITNTQIFLKNAKSFNVFHVLMLLTSCEQADHHPEDESSGFQSVLLLI